MAAGQSGDMANNTQKENDMNKNTSKVSRPPVEPSDAPRSRDFSRLDLFAAAALCGLLAARQEGDDPRDFVGFAADLAESMVGHLDDGE